MSSLKHKFRQIKKLPLWIYWFPATLMKLSFKLLYRFELIDPHNLASDPHSLVCITWHNRLLFICMSFSKQAMRNTSAVISASRDGQYLADFMKFFGVEALRGSSSRKGANAMLGAIREIESGRNVVFTPDGPRVLEYNARFGDPETQVVLPRMNNDIVEVFEACVDGTLDRIELDFADNAAVCVVLASDGYPEKYDKGFEITGFENFKDMDGYYVFHAGTKFDGDKIVTNGGRVLGVTALGTDLKDARANAYKATEWIDFANKYKRNDIGKAIDEA